MNRRVFLAQAVLPLLAWGDAEADVWEVVAGMAAGLAEPNVAAFLKPIEQALPGYETLATNVRAMLDQAEVESNIRPLRNEGSETARTLELDWQLRLKRKAEDGDGPRMVSREEAVTMRFRKDGKKWLVVKLEPLAFFAPPDFS